LAETTSQYCASDITLKQLGRPKILHNCFAITHTKIGMRWTGLLLAIILSSSTNSLSRKTDFPVSFDISMSNHYQRARVPALLYSPDEFCRWSVIRKLYQQHAPSLINQQPKSAHKIPKIIHQIWLGSSLPNKYKKYQESWIKHHPDWEYKLWTDHEVKKIKLYNQQLFDEAQNYGEKSDILRYELLYYYGGLYVDVDFECLKSFDILHTAYDFYTGIEMPYNLQLSNALIGTAPEHPIMKACIEWLEDKGSKYDYEEIMNRSGPKHFTRCFLSVAPSCKGGCIALPLSFFYPAPLAIRQYTTHRDIERWIKPETFAVHYWSASWTIPAGFVS
jgi:hypothetical protein